MSGLLHLKGLTKSFGGVRAVDDVSVTIEPGQSVALIGPNGAGKTTLINLLSGLITPDKGDIQLGATPLHHLPAHRRIKAGLGRTFQITAPFKRLTVHTNMALTLAAQQSGFTNRWLRRWPGAVDDAAHEWLKRIGLEHQANNTAGILAYGDQKRLELGLALATNPQLLLLDEPMAGVSQHDRDDLMTLALGTLKSPLEAEQNRAVLFTEHDMATVFSHADRILVLAQGKLIADGTPDAIAADADVQDIYLGKAAEGLAG